MTTIACIIAILNIISWIGIRLKNSKGLLYNLGLGITTISLITSPLFIQVHSIVFYLILIGLIPVLSEHVQRSKTTKKASPKKQNTKQVAKSTRKSNAASRNKLDNFKNQVKQLQKDYIILSNAFDQLQQKQSKLGNQANQVNDSFLITQKSEIRKFRKEINAHSSKNARLKSKITQYLNKKDHVKAYAQLHKQLSLQANDIITIRASLSKFLNEIRQKKQSINKAAVAQLNTVYKNTQSVNTPPKLTNYHTSNYNFNKSLTPVINRIGLLDEELKMVVQKFDKFCIDQQYLLQTITTSQSPLIEQHNQQSQKLKQALNDLSFKYQHYKQTLQNITKKTPSQFKVCSDLKEALVDNSKKVSNMQKVMKVLWKEFKKQTKSLSNVTIPTAAKNEISSVQKIPHTLAKVQLEQDCKRLWANFHQTTEEIFWQSYEELLIKAR